MEKMEKSKDRTVDQNLRLMLGMGFQLLAGVILVYPIMIIMSCSIGGEGFCD